MWLPVSSPPSACMDEGTALWYNLAQPLVAGGSVERLLQQLRAGAMV